MLLEYLVRAQKFSFSSFLDNQILLSGIGANRFFECQLEVLAQN